MIGATAKYYRADDTQVSFDGSPFFDVDTFETEEDAISCANQCIANGDCAYALVTVCEDYDPCRELAVYADGLVEDITVYTVF